MLRPFSLSYDIVLAAAAVITAAVCTAARRSPAKWGRLAARALALVLVADAISFVVSQATSHGISLASSLPLPLCDVATLVAAAALWWRTPILVELTYFWGLAGTAQALVTPDLDSRFPSLVFFQYVVGHVAVVAAALLLVVGLRIRPRAGAVVRVFVISAVYTAFVGAVDALTGADYMFLRRPPGHPTLLRLLGPWPWYVVSAAGVGLVMFIVLDAPFRL